MSESPDEMIGVSSVPKKSRSVKRPRDSPISASGGEVVDTIPPAKPTVVVVPLSSPPPPPPPSSSSVYVRKKKSSTSLVKPSVVDAPLPTPPPLVSPPSATNVCVGEEMIHKEATTATIKPTVGAAPSKPRKPRSASGKSSRKCPISDGGGEISTSSVKHTDTAVAAATPPPSAVLPSLPSDVGEKVIHPQATTSAAKPTVGAAHSQPREPRSASVKKPRKNRISDGGGEVAILTSPVKHTAVTATTAPPSPVQPSSSDVGEKVIHPQAATSTVKPTVVAAPSEPQPPVSPSSNVSSGKKMSKKRGLSLEEKREKMLEIFYDSQDFYLLKELEKMGPKKGVISQSVKDVIQSLVDDDLVLKDKIGTSVYFWSLPSCASNQLRNASSKLESDIKSSKKRLAELIEHRDALKKGREASDEREEALTDLKTVEVKYNELKNEMGHYSDNDPAALEAMKNATGVSHAAANRWTDNILAIRQWCSNNIPHAKEQLEHMYTEIGITEDFDYLEALEPELSQPLSQLDSSLGPYSSWTPLSIIK